MRCRKTKHGNEGWLPSIETLFDIHASEIQRWPGYSDKNL
jgi:hypothetical protein